MGPTSSLIAPLRRVSGGWPILEIDHHAALDLAAMHPIEYVVERRIENRNWELPMG